MVVEENGKQFQMVFRNQKQQLLLFLPQTQKIRESSMPLTTADYFVRLIQVLHVDTLREEEVCVPSVPEDSSIYKRKLVYKLSAYLYYLSTNVDKCAHTLLILHIKTFFLHHFPTILCIVNYHRTSSDGFSCE